MAKIQPRIANNETSCRGLAVYSPCDPFFEPQKYWVHMQVITSHDESGVFASLPDERTPNLGRGGMKLDKRLGFLRSQSPQKLGGEDGIHCDVKKNWVLCPLSHILPLKYSQSAGGMLHRTAATCQLTGPHPGHP